MQDIYLTSTTEARGLEYDSAELSALVELYTEHEILIVNSSTLHRYDSYIAMPYTRDYTIIIGL